MKVKKVSAGVIMYRWGSHASGRTLEVLLARPGGPYYQNKEDGIWTIPKGEVNEGEDLLVGAKREFYEETGHTIPDTAKLHFLGNYHNSSKREHHIWCFQGSFPEGWLFKSNNFEMEWPPKSGKLSSFPEISEVRFFSLDEAQSRITPSQKVMLERLLTHVAGD